MCISPVVKELKCTKENLQKPNVIRNESNRPERTGARVHLSPQRAWNFHCGLEDRVLEGQAFATLPPEGFTQIRRVGWYSHVRLHRSRAKQTHI